MNQTNFAYADDEPTVFTIEEYLTFERNALDRHEYYEGAIVKMAGASERHNIITGNIFVELRSRLRTSDCRVYTGEMRTRIQKTRYVYPDVVAVCGERKFEDKEFDVLLNPNVIVEVLSKSTKARDKNEKLDSYLTLESVTDYVLVEQDRVRVEHYGKQSKDNWKFHVSTKLEQNLILAILPVELPLAAIYTDVELPTNLELVED